MPESVICPCGSTNASKRIIQAVDELSGEIFSYFACPDCTLFRLSPRPTATEIGAYYPQHYAPHVGPAPSGLKDALKRLIYQIYWAPDEDVPLRTRQIR
ncbi:methionine biosynthesis protein MetW, partial [mine drainage metagenome]